MTDLCSDSQKEQARKRRERDAGNTSLPVLSLPPQRPGLREAAPQSFERFLSVYMEILQSAREPVGSLVPNRNPAPLEQMAEQMGGCFAVPRDVVELHYEALKRLLAQAGPERSQSYAGRGRLAAMELMGRLALMYRRYPAGDSQVKVYAVVMQKEES